MRVAIITGAGKGIGAGIARYLLTKGMNVVIAEVDGSTKKDFPKDPSRLLFVETDLKKESSIEKMVKEAVRHFGRIDALINNAAIGIEKMRVPAEKLPLETWEEVIAVNLTAPFLCAKYTAPYLRKQKGSIVNIASTRAFQSEPNTLAYSATKGGVVSLTHALAISFGPDIRVNCISPGWINSHHETLRKIDHLQHPVGRVGEVQDIAAMVAFLLSEEAGFITGSNFIVDGGMTKKMVYVE